MSKPALGMLEWLGFCQRRCANCHAPYFVSDLAGFDYCASERLCPACQQALQPFVGNVCRRCRLPLEVGQQIGVCEVCQQEPPPWMGAACHGLYAGQLRDLILRLKFGGELHLARILAEFIFEAVNCLPKPALIVPIPQFPRHLRKRGFNQAHEIGRELARLAGIPFNPELLERVRPGKPQEGLNARERKENLTGAFRANACPGKTIWLLDDVLTTGSTCASAANELLQAGAKAIYAVFVARTPLI